MDFLRHDLRHAARSLRRQPALAAAALLTIALTVGAASGIAAVADALLLRPLPYREPDRLVHLFKTQLGSATSDRSEPSYPDFEAWRAGVRSFEGIEGFQRQSLALTGGDEPEFLPGARVSAGFFRLLGVRPAAGRTFVDGEDAVGAERVAVISYGLWVRRYGRDPSVVGRTIQLAGRPTTVVGVLPASFSFAPLGAVDAWIPLDAPAELRANGGTHWFRAIARLRPGVTLEQAERELAAVAAERAVRFPETNAERGATFEPLRDVVVGRARPAVTALLAAVALLLLAGCANVGTLLLSRAASRRRELAVRVALGATTGRVMRQQAAETLLLATVGGAAGAAIATPIARLLVSLVPVQQRATLPGLEDVGEDLRTLGVALAVAASAAALAGLLPAWRVARNAPADSLGGGRTSTGGRGDRARDALVVAEVALALALLVGTALMGRSVAGLLATDPGFAPERLLTLRLTLSPVRYEEPEEQARFFTDLLERVRRLPGVTGVAATTKLPFDAGNTSSYLPEGAPEPPAGQRPDASIRSVSDDYFRVLGIGLLGGRGFTAHDQADAPKAIVINEALARRHFGGAGSAVGRRIEVSGDSLPWSVVGVARDVKTGALDAPATPTIYFPLRQQPPRSMNLAIRTSGLPEALAAAVQREVRALDPDQPVYAVSTMDDLIASSPPVFLRRLPLLLFGAFACAGIGLAVVGIVGVMAFNVARRTRELGIRLALGATPGNVVRLVLSHGAKLVALGLAVGMLLALTGARLLRSLLYGITTADAASYTLTAALLGAVALIACWLPARRAASVEPTVVLREE
ncbi:MAG TPA: ABC transporter permease [Gemmatimonadales bacterium]|nr:ABC transporter permease [Gemmatimonadales bacterium]